MRADHATLFVLFLGFFALGWLCSLAYMDNKFISTFDGHYFEGNYTQYTAREKSELAERGSNKGNWICVNVYGMSYDRAIEVCRHETAHEIFSTYCEDKNNIDKCINMTK
jgi:hypothetical protein